MKFAWMKSGGVGGQATANHVQFRFRGK